MDGNVSKWAKKREQKYEFKWFEIYKHKLSLVPFLIF